jgi:Amt family ammonium transporter
MGGDLYAEIDALFTTPDLPEDVGGGLALIAEALRPLDPRLIWLADAEGHPVATYVSLDAHPAPGREQLAAQTRDLLARLQGLRACAFRDGQPPAVGWIVSLGLPAEGHTIAGTLGRCQSPEQWVVDSQALLECCGRLALDRLQAQAEYARQAIRLKHLQAERDTLQSSYTQIMARSLEERERRLQEQAQHMEHLEREVAKRSADLREALEKANAASQAKTEFLANMSHEIRTPMTAILGCTDLLIEESWGRKEALRWLEVIRRNGEHLLSIINDILDISKIEAGKMPIERISCCPIELIEDVEVLMRPRAVERNLAFEIHLATPVPQTITSDPTRVRQILVNLISNAIKFTPKGGITVTLSLIEPAAPNHEPLLKFEVADTGIGIEPHQAQRLFKPFSQADTSTTRKFGGTGLGLAISKRLAEALNGSLTLQSAPGKGSTFCVTIATGPIDGVPRITGRSPKSLPEPIETPPPPPTRGTPPLADTRILLAEDGKDNQTLISTLLKKAGAQVDIAENGRIACEVAMQALRQGCPFDLIFMDMQMPELDGCSATSRLRQEGYRGPIVALTANVMSSDRAKCLEAGCDDFVPKPINVKSLLETAATYIRLGRREANPARLEPPQSQSPGPPDALTP